MQVDSINGKCLIIVTIIAAVISDVVGVTELVHECAWYAPCLTPQFSQKHHPVAIYICMPADDASDEVCPY